MALTSLYEDLRDAEREPGTVVLAHELTTADGVAADALGLALGASVTHLRRQRTADGIPVAILENYLPPEFVDITAEQLAEHGLYQILRARGVTIRVAQQRLGCPSRHQ